MELNHYRSKEQKLFKKLRKYLKSKKPLLADRYGAEKAENIVLEAEKTYDEIIDKMPYFHTPMYDMLIVIGSMMIALKKGMKSSGIELEEFVRFSITDSRMSANKIPKGIRMIFGKLYLSRLVRWYLRRVARSATKNGWPTKLLEDVSADGCIMSLETRDCQMINFVKSTGEKDLEPYCTFFDFTTAEAFGIGLKQVSSIDSGVCKYCFYKKGPVKWPEAVKKVLGKE